MKHLSTISRRPAKAATTDLSIGDILTVIAQIISVIGTALSSKSSSS